MMEKVLKYILFAFLLNSLSLISFSTSSATQEKEPPDKPKLQQSHIAQNQDVYSKNEVDLLLKMSKQEADFAKQPAILDAQKNSQEDLKNKIRTQNRKTQPLSIVALVIALIGGVPGIIALVDYYKRSSIQIGFNQEQSLACRIRSETPTIDGKPVILLYLMTITGKRLQPSYLREINHSIKMKGKWFSGREFAPLQRDHTDKNGVTKKAVHLRLERPHDHLNILVASWENFRPGQKGLSYGEPEDFSYAAYFDIDANEFTQCRKLRILVIDYLGNKYSDTVDFSQFMKKYENLFLMQ